MKKTIFLCLLVCFGLQLKAQDGFIGEVRLFAGNFAPKNWAFCEGQLLPIQTNYALFALLGTTYGGDGITTFALPDLRSRVPMGSSEAYPLGAKPGTETKTITPANLPNHTHSFERKVSVTTEKGTSDDPQGRILASDGTPRFADPDSITGTLSQEIAATSVSSSNGSPIVENRQPTLAVSYIICLYGIFPTRDN